MIFFAPFSYLDRVIAFAFNHCLSANNRKYTYILCAHFQVESFMRCSNWSCTIYLYACLWRGDCASCAQPSRTNINRCRRNGMCGFWRAQHYFLHCELQAKWQKKKERRRESKRETNSAGEQYAFNQIENQELTFKALSCPNIFWILSDGAIASHHRHHSVSHMCGMTSPVLRVRGGLLNGSGTGHVRMSHLRKTTRAEPGCTPADPVAPSPNMVCVCALARIYTRISLHGPGILQANFIFIYGQNVIYYLDSWSRHRLSVALNSRCCQPGLNGCTVRISTFAHHTPWHIRCWHNDR